MDAAYFHHFFSAPTGDVVVNDPITLGPGVLSWTSDTDDNTPNLSLDLPDGVQDGDVIRWQVSTNSDFSGGITNQDGADVGSDPTVFEWPDTLSDGTYWIRALIVRDGSTISTSNTETKTIDAVADYETESEAIFAAFTTPLTTLVRGISTHLLQRLRMGRHQARTF